jgi:hypothetical protein
MGSIHVAGSCIDAAHIERQRTFSIRAFGPGLRTEGVLDHIAKESAEVRQDPTDLGEWVDIIILAFDGAHRTGADPDDIIAAIKQKQARNESRTWPDWRTADPTKAIEHDRSVIEVASTRLSGRPGFHEMWDGCRWVPICDGCGDEAAYCDGSRHAAEVTK